MASILDEKNIFVKERVRMFKFGNVFEFFNLDNVKIGEAREEEITTFKKFVKMTNMKTMLPFTIGIYGSDGSKIVTLKKPFKWFLPRVFIYDNDGTEIGKYVQKFKFFKSEFHLFGRDGIEFAKIVGNFVGWKFVISFMDGRKIGEINKKFAGIGKELFTTADNYVVRFEEGVSLSDEQKKILVSVSCVIDMIFKEYGKR